MKNIETLFNFSAKEWSAHVAFLNNTEIKMEFIRNIIISSEFWNIDQISGYFKHI